VKAQASAVDGRANVGGNEESSLLSSIRMHTTGNFHKTSMTTG